MSFLVPSQRGIDNVTQQTMSELPSIHSQSSRLAPPLSHLDGYSHQSMSSSPHDVSSFVTDRTPSNMPKVGETRCYWSLLSSSLNFIYLDPIFTQHMGEQAGLLLEKPLLYFVHPDDQDTAREDLEQVLQNKTLHGSVTRVRYCRLSRMRRLLGYQGPPVWGDGDKVSVDNNYLPVDLVISWAAKDLVLCFIHATVDLTPGDNDKDHKTRWTNWCGTPPMGKEQIDLLHQRLRDSIAEPQVPTSVFQILSAQPDKHLLYSWPPDRGLGYVGERTAKDFAKLVDTLPMNHDGDKKTSCTSRLKTSPMTLSKGQVESVFIPYGSIIFACHKIIPRPSRHNTSDSSTEMRTGYNSSGDYATHANYHYEHDTSNNTYPLRSAASPSPPYDSYLPPPHSQSSAPLPYPSHDWSQPPAPPSSHSQYNAWPSHSPNQPAPSLPPSSTRDRTSSYPSQPLPWPTPSPPYVDSGSLPPNFHRPLSPSHAYSGVKTEEIPSMSNSPTGSAADVVPPPKRRMSPGVGSSQYSRNTGHRPVGVLRCSSCKATTSPEWRKGPSGKKELCNACGLRYARSRAKKEGKDGNTQQRRRKDKGLAGAMKRGSPHPTSPPTGSNIPYPDPNLRRSGYDDTSFGSANSAGSASGSEIYPHSGHQHLEGATPSPSPPSSDGNFIHYSHPYAHHHSQRLDHRPPAGNQNAMCFYSTTAPSPLSHPPLHHGQHAHHSSIGSTSGSRMDHFHSYTSASPISHSPVTSTMPLSSFEREKDKDR